ncbi:hypothetical protein [Actinoplanes sp. NPDC051859]|uniref:hypothetical protein n=1 Tax=Actinoplanes sp. NPDC051859 TaxID=3363909 RepID=UPI0037B81EC1
MRHRPVRLWCKSWKKRCACGCRWYPCPDSITAARPPVSWNERTVAVPQVRFRNDRPLMTRGQEWRSTGPERWV